jgi:hypothetical protein
MKQQNARRTVSDARREKHRTANSRRSCAESACSMEAWGVFARSATGGRWRAGIERSSGRSGPEERNLGSGRPSPNRPAASGESCLGTGLFHPVDESQHDPPPEFDHAGSYKTLP